MIEAPPRRAEGTVRFDRQVVPMEPDMVEANVAELPEKTVRAERPRAFYGLMWETALRTGTLQRLRTPEDYRPGDRALQVRDKADKSRFGRELPLKEAARAILDAVCNKRGEGLIFGRHTTAVKRSGRRRSGPVPGRIRF